MSAKKCTICGEQVYSTDADMVLRTQTGDSVCHAPYWIVYTNRRALRTFFGKNAMKRAKEYAGLLPKGYKTKRINPHGHQVR